jgi:hypothetical protein
MRLLIASMAALAAVAFAAPSFAQTEEPATAPAPAPVPATKAKPGTTAYCQTLKSSTSRSACMKKLHAQATPKATTTKKKTKKTTTAATQPEVGQLAPPAASAPAPAQSGGTVAVPPLPQKTI